MFIDETGIDVLAGRGGDGCVSWRREKYVPRGGPSGGKGGRGGHVLLRASKDIHTLYDIGNTRIFRAEAGQKGMPSNCTGRSGEDIVVRVPIGTLVKDLESKELLMDLKEDGQTFVAAKGGRGGLGNASFKSMHPPDPRPRPARQPGQSAQAAPGAEAGRRRGPGRLPQCRQELPHPQHVRGHARRWPTIPSPP